MGGEKLEFQTYPRANMAISWEIKEGFPKREVFDKAIRMRSTSSLKVKVKPIFTMANTGVSPSGR